MDANGGYGNVGFSPGGVDYGIVTGIKKFSPKSYQWTMDHDSMRLASGNEGTESGWNLFDGWWNRPSKIHKVKYLLSCVSKVTFKGGDTWSNPDYDNWLKAHEGKTLKTAELEGYYDNITPVVPIHKAASRTKNCVTLTYGSVNNIGGYQIAYSSNNSFSSPSYVNTSKTSATIKNLRSGTTYYFKIRTYAKQNGKTVYNEYGPAKSVRAK